MLRRIHTVNLVGTQLYWHGNIAYNQSDSFNATSTASLDAYVVLILTSAPKLKVVVVHYAKARH
jgi:hypothetical protein